MPSSKTISCYFALFLALAGLTAGGLCLLMDYSAGGKAPGERYYRAVYVLQRMEAKACAEEENIPAGVIYTDATESLLHHPDKILVLRHLADELAAMRRERPKARFYEACCRLALGERENAADLLSRYVIDNEYNASHYAMLCEALYELENYKSLLLMCREWQERDSSCREDRIRYAWAAQYNLGRYAEARRVMQGEGACLGWRAPVYDAKAVLAAQGEDEAAKILNEALARLPEYRMQMLRLWNILRPKQRI